MNPATKNNSTSNPNFLNNFGTSRGLPFSNDTTSVPTATCDLLIKNVLFVTEKTYEGESVYVQDDGYYEDIP